MQIPFSSWNSATSAIGSIQSGREVTSRPSATPTVAAGVEQVAKGENQTDRDAQERYDGPAEGATPPSPQEEISPPNSQAETSLLDLPANSQEPPSSLDLLG